MLVWLASYPRSGNSYVRMFLKDVFGLGSWSIYDEGGERAFDQLNKARRSDDLYIVKTHERPLTDDPAIYVVRDGRASIISYFHYLNEVENQPIPLEQVIDGNVWPGSWSEHFLTWDPEYRRNTLLLRYEIISKDTSLLANVLGPFLGLTPLGTSTLSFDELHAASPNFFRTGNDASNIKEMEPFMTRFNKLHKPLMRRLGYTTSGPAS